MKRVEKVCFALIDFYTKLFNLDSDMKASITCLDKQITDLSTSLLTWKTELLVRIDKIEFETIEVLVCQANGDGEEDVEAIEK